MFAVVTLLLISLTSLIVTRIATVALTLTGLSREVARFQARSALSGAGFTTMESEAVVNHPVRRRIVLMLIFLGSVGVVSLVATLSAALVRNNGFAELGRSGLLLVVGLAGIYFLAGSRWFDRALTPLMRRALKRYTDLDVRDYAALLQVAGDFAVMELLVEPSDWLADRTLAQLRLPDEGVLVLGIQRPGRDYIGTPDGELVIHPNDTLVLYGRRQQLAELDRRQASTGDAAHAAAIRQQQADDRAEPDGA